MTYSDKPSPNELAHYGVKGMKWGVRKKREPVTLAEGYSQRQFDNDRRNWSERSARRINERVQKGKTVNQARVSEANRRAAIRLAAFGAAFVGLHLAQAGSYKIQNRAMRKRQEAGAKTAARMFSDKRGIPSYSTLNLNFNPSTGVWG